MLFTPSGASGLCVGRPASPLAIVLIATLALFVVWHQAYVPLHLIGHAHFNGADHITGGSVNHEDNHHGEAETDQNDHDHSDRQHGPHHGGHHKTHSAGDHLAGYYAVSAPECALVLAFNVSVAPPKSEQAAPKAKSISPHERGPPRPLPG